MKRSISWCILFISTLVINLNAQNFWNSTIGPEGGQVASLKMVPNGDIYAGGVGGIFFSSDKGENWTVLNNGLNNHTVNSIVIDSAGNIFLGTDSGVYLSSDNGNTWNFNSNGLPGNLIVLSLGINSAGNLYAGTNDGIYRSTNKGKSWVSSNGGLSNRYINVLNIQSNGDIYAGTTAGLFRSTNSGINWVQVINALNNSQVYAVSSNSAGNIFVGASSGSVYMSTDNGVNWDLKNSGLAGYLIRDFAFDSVGNTYITSSVGVYYSSNSGDSWSAMSSVIPANYYPTDLIIDPSGTLYLATSSGILRASSVESYWEIKNKNIISSQLSSISFNSNGQIFGSTLMGKLFRSTINRDKWDELTLDYRSPSVLSAVTNSKGDIIASTSNYGIYRSTDNGNSFLQVSNGIDSVNVHNLVIDTVGRIYACSSNKGVYISNDNGDNWSPLNTGMQTANIVSLTTDSKGNLFAGSVAGIYSSRNNGQTWTYLNTSLNSRIVNSILLSQNGFIFAAVFNGLFRSTDNGLTFIQLTNGLSSTEFKSVTSNPVGYLYAGSAASGIFRSTDNGNHWTQVNSGLTNVNISVLASDSKGYLIAGTNGSGACISINSTIPPLPVSPTSKLPLDKSLGNPLSLGLSWDSVAYAESYTVQVATDTNFTNPVVNDSLLTVPSRQLTGLNDGVRYYWRVAAKNVIGTSSYSGTRSFSTAINTPGTLNAQALPSERVILSWTDKSNNNLGYIIERKLAAENNYIVIDTLKSDIIGYTDTSLISINTYKYRIKSYNLIETSLYSNEVTIKTLPSYPSLPLLIAPLNNLSNLSATLYLSWNGSAFADSYRLQVTKDSTFKSYFFNDSTITTTTKQITGLDDGVKYYWRVSSKNAAGVSSYSEIRLFSTILNTPGNLSASALWGYKVSLKWTDASSNESGYMIERKLSTDTSYTLIDSVKLNIISFTDSSLTSINTYNYRVKAYNTFGSSLYSNIAAVSTITSVNNKYSQIPTKYELSQNYPNPFNPTTVIEYGLPIQSQVRILVYNILGEVVKELANSQQSAGYHTVSFGANNISSGIYFYKIEAKASDGSKQFREIKKMLLLK